MIKKYKKINILFTLIIIIITFFSLSKVSFASTEVYFQNYIKDIKKGDTFSINLKISSPDKLINVIDGTITYDKDKLEIKSTKIDNSILSLWVREPVFNNQTGELNLVGGVPNGFSGAGGQIIEITFLAKNDGQTRIGFRDIFSVLVNNGSGTNINPWLKPLSLTIGKKQSFYTGLFIYMLLFVLIITSFIIILLFKLKNKKNVK